jgi:hypothetical protein
LYPATLLKMFLRFMNFLVEFLGCFKNRINLKIWIILCHYFLFIFISFCCLIAIAKNSSTILNKCAESGCLHLTLNSLILEEMLLVFPTYNNIGCRFDIIAFIMLSYEPSCPNFFRAFTSWWNIEFCQRIYLHLLRWSFDFYHWVYFCNVLCLFIDVYINCIDVFASLW